MGACRGLPGLLLGSLCARAHGVEPRRRGGRSARAQAAEEPGGEPRALDEAVDLDVLVQGVEPGAADAIAAIAERPSESAQPAWLGRPRVRRSKRAIA